MCVPHPSLLTPSHCLEVNLHAGMAYHCSLNFFRKAWVTKSRAADFSLGFSCSQWHRAVSGRAHHWFNLIFPGRIKNIVLVPVRMSLLSFSTSVRGFFIFPAPVLAAMVSDNGAVLALSSLACTFFNHVRAEEVIWRKTHREYKKGSCPVLWRIANRAENARRNEQSPLLYTCTAPQCDLFTASWCHPFAWKLKTSVTNFILASPKWGFT